MGITVLIVREDLTTVVKDIGSIEWSSEIQKIAASLGLVLIPTIDLSGITVFNHLQDVTLKKELCSLYANHHITKKILDIFEYALKYLEVHSYIKLVGKINK